MFVHAMEPWLRLGSWLMKLTDNIWLVGSGASGFSMTHPRDCHVYLVADQGEAVLIDAGAGVDVAPILTQIDRCGVPRSTINRIVLTHAHTDHSGGAAALRKALDAQVLASPEVASYLRDGDEQAASFDRMKRPGGYPDDYSFRACPVDAELSDGQRLTVGTLELEVLSTPGHSSGHLSYALHRAGVVDLFSGDAAFANGRILLQDMWDCSVVDSTQSIRRLADLKPDGLYPGHGTFALSLGWHHLYSAMEEISAGLPPRQLTF
jgi:glyoxylase-like metal-dependent hydrolase (beta-lactamase superfamily II)